MVYAKFTRTCLLLPAADLILNSKLSERYTKFTVVPSLKVTHGTKSHNHIQTFATAALHLNRVDWQVNWLRPIVKVVTQGVQQEQALIQWLDIISALQTWQEEKCIR